MEISHFPEHRLDLYWPGLLPGYLPQLPPPPAHYQMLIRSETINKSMAAGLAGDCFQGMGRGGGGEWTWSVDIVHKDLT